MKGKNLADLGVVSVMVGCAVLALSCPAAVAEEASVCRVIASALPRGATTMPDETVLQAMARLSGGLLQFPKQTTDGLSMQTRVEGSLHCETNTLFVSEVGARHEIEMPSHYRGGETDYCGGSGVKLAEINGKAALIEHVGDETSLQLEIAERRNGDWLPSCHLAIKIANHYAIQEKSCVGEECGELEDAALKFSEMYDTDASTLAALRGRRVLPEKQSQWDTMLRQAETQDIGSADAPVSDTGCVNSYFEYYERLFTPIETRTRLLLAKVGTAGFGTVRHWGPLISVYELADDKTLRPVAGYCVDVGTVTLTSIIEGEPRP
jgi:hypothetical protein